MVMIKAAIVQAEAELNDTKTAGVIWDALPIETRANLWGDEIYFAISIEMGLCFLLNRVLPRLPGRMQEFTGNVRRDFMLIFPNKHRIKYSQNMVVNALKASRRIC